MRISIAICQVIERKYRSQLEGEDQIDAQLYLKKARTYLDTEDLLSALKTQKLSLDYVESLYQQVQKFF